MFGLDRLDPLTVVRILPPFAQEVEADYILPSEDNQRLRELRRMTSGDSRKRGSQFLLRCRRSNSSKPRKRTKLFIQHTMQGANIATEPGVDHSPVLMLSAFHAGQELA